MATKGTGWVVRRSTALVPYLLFVGLRELWATAGLDEPPGPRGDDGAGQTADTGVAGS